MFLLFYFAIFVKANFSLIRMRKRNNHCIYYNNHDIYSFNYSLRQMFNDVMHFMEFIA